MKKYSTSLNAPILSSNTEIDWYGQSWVDRAFSHPENTVRIGTAFSGIGSPEMALQQLGVKHDIVSFKFERMNHLYYLSRCRCYNVETSQRLRFYTKNA